MESSILKQIQTCLSLPSIDSLTNLKNILNLLDIHFFHYTKIYLDGSRVLLSTHPSVISRFFEKDIFKSHILHTNTSILNSFNILWTDLNESKEVLESRIQTGIGNIGLSIIQRIPNSFHQIYHFATKNQSNALELLNSKLKLIYHFINYFHSEYNTILTDLEKYKFSPPQPFPLFTNQEELLIETFLKKTKIKKVTSEYSKQPLSHKELAVLSYCIQGYSTKEIARTIYRSVRTVESHIDSLKMKFRCDNIKSLIICALKDKLLEAELQLAKT